ncbi:aromatic acid exporter family protein [Paenibacillus pinihumi]|uniref:aromatic acid exporter family protein n=1 Tax=Paenibacillus pinihumi TaxID=669462 RepID=UPI0004290421|nr:aromatic acid exporter family protein [Paenibacillus pinihumi]
MGIRIIKTAVAALAAIYTALYLGLVPALSAGLIAILAVEVTRMRGIRIAFVRLVASMVGLFFASLIFLLFGFEIWALSIFVLIAFPILSRLNLKDGIVASSVIVFHMFDRQEVSWHLIGNEFMLLITGLGWALIVNLLYMPREDKALERSRRLIEQLFNRIFTEMGSTLRNPAHLWNGEQLLEAHDVIEKGLRKAESYRENRIWGYERYWRTYYEMRSEQLESIQQMLPLLALVYEKLPQGELLAEVLGSLSEEVMSDVYEGRAERELEELEEVFRGMPLPVSREEFEIRSALLQLCRELERFLSIAKKWKKRRQAQPSSLQAGS